MSLTIRQVYELARGAGLGHSAAITATAVAMAESGLNPAAVGDTSLTDATWGPSIGLWQIRSVKADKGTGKPRDAERLATPSFNAHSMASISSGGSDWSPWSAYKNGSYTSHLGEVRAAVGAGTASAGTYPAAATGGTPASFTDPGDLLGDAGDALGGLLGDAADGATGVAGKVVSLLLKEGAPAALIGLGILGGFALITIGAWRGVSD